MVKLVFGVNISIFILFLILYAYQMLYLFIGLRDKLKKQVVHQDKVDHNQMVVLVCARNEEAVIGQLLDSISKQDYPQDKLRTVVIADNCTDETAKVARSYGATVYERFNRQEVGKGYALRFAFEQIFSDENAHDDAFVIIDADNLLDKNYIKSMNQEFAKGYDALTSYRNSKNYAQNWISAGYGLWFLREAEYLNRPRMLRGTSCAVSGTGFLISADLLKSQDGWHYHTLTEDIEFSVVTTLHGVRIGYAKNAILYDEQPVTFAQSWRQRMRWAKGFYQVLGYYGKNLVRTVFSSKKDGKTRFGCYDMVMTIMPALFVTLGCIFFNIVMLIYAQNETNDFVRDVLVYRTNQAIFMSFFLFYLTLYLIGLLTTITEWNQILASTYKKIISTFTFPLFMFTYIPIAVAAIFMKVEWKPITHTVSKSIEDMKK